MNRESTWELIWLPATGNGLIDLRTRHIMTVSPFLSTKPSGSYYLTFLGLEPLSFIASTRYSLSSMGILWKKISCCKYCFCLFFKSIIWANKCVLVWSFKNPFTSLSPFLPLLFSPSFSTPPPFLPPHTSLSLPTPPFVPFP